MCVPIGEDERPSVLRMIAAYESTWITRGSVAVDSWLVVACMIETAPIGKPRALVAYTVNSHSPQVKPVSSIGKSTMPAVYYWDSALLAGTPDHTPMHGLSMIITVKS